MTCFNDYPEADRIAFQLAIEMTLRDKDPSRIAQIKAMLERDPLIDVAQFASYHQQMQNLNLQPWERPPCWVDPDAVPPSSNDPGVVLTRRMRKAGISGYHPDPLRALAEAEGAAP